MDIKLIPAKLNGTVAAVSSKSDAHRILICAALSDRQTVVHCNLISDDIRATINCLNALGAVITEKDGDIIVKPIKRRKKAVLDCGESGSTLRFLLPVASALGTSAEFGGHGRLPSRPVTPLRREMESNGVTFSPPWEFPIKTKGRLLAGEYMLKGNVSSQFVSGLLFSLPLLDGDSTIRLIPPVESVPYIKLTVNVLARFGVSVSRKKNTYYIKGNQHFVSPGEITVEGDWSNSAFFLAAGAMGGKVSVTGLDRKSLQGDKAVIDILRQMGAEIRWYKDKVTVKGNNLTGVQINAADIPDLIPVLSVVGATATEGITAVTNAGRLRLKESDRLAAICECLNNIGVVDAETDDGLIIWSGDGIRGGNVFSFNDHRLVMSMAVAACASRGEITIRDAEAVNKSYPTFFEDYNSLGGKADVINTQGE